MPKKSIKKEDKKKVDVNLISHDEFLTEDGKKATLITKDGLKNLKEELDQLKSVKRREVAARIKEAISFGDLSENSEYEEAKNEQAFLEGRILDLEQKIKNAKIISDKHQTVKSVQLGSMVHLANLAKTKDNIEIYTIVGSTEADPFEAKISNESPVGSALLDKNKGDKIKVHVPSGSVEYEIMKVE